MNRYDENERIVKELEKQITELNFEELEECVRKKTFFDFSTNLCRPIR